MAKDIKQTEIDTAKTQRRRGKVDIKRGIQVRIGRGEDKFNVDEKKTSFGTITRSVVRTSDGPDRIEMSFKNELGAEADGIYIYRNNKISIAFTFGTIFFYDLDGNVTASIQQPNPGVLSIGTVPGGVLSFSGLPTSRPTGFGQVWNDNGTLKIT